MTFLVLVSLVSLGGGPVEFTGERPHVWTNRCVIVGLIDRTQVIGQEADGNRELRVAPLATLAGPFDPTAQPSITLLATIHPRTSNLGTIPKDGTTALILFSINNKVGGATIYSIHSGTVKFFPKRGVAIVPVKDLADEKVLSTISALRKLRGVEKAPDRK